MHPRTVKWNVFVLTLFGYRLPYTKLPVLWHIGRVEKHFKVGIINVKTEKVPMKATLTEQLHMTDWLFR